MECLAYTEMALAYTEPNPDEIRLPEIKFNSNWHQHFKSAGLIFASISILLATLAPIKEVSAYYSHPGKYYVRTNGGCLHVRTGPGTHYRSVACYPNGSRLRVVGYRHGFARLSNGCYVAAQWIRPKRVKDCIHCYGYRRVKHYYGHRRVKHYYSRSRILTIGSRGSAVIRVQRALGVRATGYYGYATANAVRHFQANSGLIVDGVVGPQTRRALGIYAGTYY
ncbi:peptidoglycan-binding protein [Fischerella sp. PCC 9605]|uniref:peptidoglycan-binding protein n=1 Tax=Fischerella sp. PCC 9605 TaxID=1173024 RepID=UPI00047AF10E|nr:peptidoglycan-binding protein [Fischerella sp. PCC 9605]